MDFLSILLGILLFFIIILVHEFGHFIVAKLCGMKIDEFAIGMGPAILKKRIGETVYALKILPVGGSVSLGEDEESNDPRSFRNRPVLMRILVIAAGAFMNFILGFIFCVISVLTSSAVSTTTVAGFHTGAVSNAYLQPGDKILEINGMPIFTTMDMSFQLTNTNSRALGSQYYVYDFKIDRNGEVLLLEDVKFASRSYAVMVAEYNSLKGENTAYANNISDYFDIATNTFTEQFISLEKSGEASVFCTSVREIAEKYKQSYTSQDNPLFLDYIILGEEKTFGNVIASAGASFISNARIVWISLINLITGTYGLNDLSGPIGVVQSVGTVAAFGWSSLMTLAALIAINVGIVNLLPIPAMDGARLVFLFIEAIRRKPIKAEHEGMVHFIGILALMLLMVFVTINDVIRIFTGG